MSHSMKGLLRGLPGDPPEHEEATATVYNPATRRLEVVDLLTGSIIIDNLSQDTNTYRYSPEKSDVIADLVRIGYTLTRIAAMEGMPPAPVIYGWRRVYPDFARKLRAAVKERASHYMEKVTDTALELMDGQVELKEASVMEKGLKAMQWVVEKGDPGTFAVKNPHEQGNVTIVVDTGVRRDYSQDGGQEDVLYSPPGKEGDVLTNSIHTHEDDAPLDLSLGLPAAHRLLDEPAPDILPEIPPAERGD